MSGTSTTEHNATDPKTAARRAWALGDYHRFARELIWEVGAELASTLKVAPRQRILDVAAGSGNFALRAAEAGGEVVALDLTPENFEAGRREAAARGVQIEWVEGDAEALPFPDGRFDIVASVFGAIFAPDQAATARELARVCRPGGLIGMTNFTPEGLGGRFFELVGSYMPAPPPGIASPLAWGSESHVRNLFDGAGEIRLVRKRYVERTSSPEAYWELLSQSFGPVVAIRQALSEDPESLDRLDRELADFTASGNTGPAGGPAEYPYEYLEVTVRRS